MSKRQNRTAKKERTYIFNDNEDVSNPLLNSRLQSSFLHKRKDESAENRKQNTKVSYVTAYEVDDDQFVLRNMKEKSNSFITATSNIASK